MDDDWRPTASIKNLQTRANLLANARSFFNQRNVLEVETPLLAACGVVEANITSFELSIEGELKYLQTSPEYAMKRLLAAGMGDCYQICKSFRAKEAGVLHNPEFTIIEWYRLSYSMQQIMRETVEFIQELLSNGTGCRTVQYVSYCDVSERVLGRPIIDYSHAELCEIAIQYGLTVYESLSIEQLYDFIFSSCVVPTFDATSITVVSNYPASQASLAALDDADKNLAQRFEVFANHIELANGYVELIDADQQRERFEQDQATRLRRELPGIKIDQRLMHALQHGLPQCAGVAVGFDRLLMLVVGASSIDEVISFDWNHA